MLKKHGILPTVMAACHGGESIYQSTVNNRRGLSAAFALGSREALVGLYDGS